MLENYLLESSEVGSSIKENNLPHADYIWLNNYSIEQRLSHELVLLFFFFLECEALRLAFTGDTLRSRELTNTYSLKSHYI